MAQMHDIKLRIKGIGQTRQISRVMMLISAAKLKRARLQLEASRPYFNKVKSTIADILVHSANVESCFFGRENPESASKPKKPGNTEDIGRAGDTGRAGDAGTVGYLIISGDKGLAGGYNINLIKHAEKELEDAQDTLLFVVGNKGRNYFSRKNFKVHCKFEYQVEDPTVSQAAGIARTMVDMYLKEELSEVYLVFTEMVSSVKLEPRTMRLLPLDLESLQGEAGETQSLDEGLVYEPSPSEVLNAIIPIYVEGVIYGTLVEAFTSEQCARMMAMDNATANADKMLQKLRLNYNRCRQAAITQEISEIMGGAAELQ